MSGHSHWANIKYKKEKEDRKRGSLFSRLSLQIINAAREGGPDPDFNLVLRSAVEEAKKANMPKDNIENAIKRGSGPGGNLEEQSLEGYGPFGVAFLIQVATDNRNRTLSEIRRIFEDGGGSLGGVGSTRYIFETGTPQFEVPLEGEPSERVKGLINHFHEQPDVVKVLTNAKFT